MSHLIKLKILNCVSVTADYIVMINFVNVNFVGNFELYMVVHLNDSEGRFL